MRPRLTKFRRSLPAAVLLHLMLPGLGHIYRREYLFGVFIFLVMLIAAALCVLTLFLSLPLYAMFIICGLPLIFYVFSFGDLVRVTRRPVGPHPLSPLRFRLTLGVAVVYQCLWPLAPANFAWQNAPYIFVLDTTGLAPLYQPGDLLKASRLDYMINTYLLEKPVFHSLPDRFDIVRFRENGTARCGLVIGFPGETVEVVDGVVTANDVPHFPPSEISRLLNGYWPATDVGDYSLLIAVPELGQIAKVYDVPITELIGRVARIL